ncbi:hypothetical protein K504DRAFT_384036 [Pleomassaria siparia CBS 279.74]|uniref:Integral membrane protein n=1 Tax=Pleomassaria siparia CBS 279.74 TaxID=1314801 RepID=A0A6G1K3Y2_9PLEO|nr:hypothetical protein K504DRAFT_384036 [Pleomassaria siparia CBS 279.74]
MDKFKSKTRSARNRLAEHTSQGTGSGSLSVPHSTLVPGDNSSTLGVKEGYLGPQPGTTDARDFAVLEDKNVPPTSLQSSVDAGIAVPSPSPSRFGHSARQSSNNAQDVPMVQIPARGSSNTTDGQVQQQQQQQQQRSRPNMGSRNPSIGIRRMQSSQELRDIATNSNTSSTIQLQPAPSRLPMLEEDCQLDTAPPSSNSSFFTPDQHPGRFKRANNAFQTKLGFKKDKGKDVEASDLPPSIQGELLREYAANMVDVLDTLDPEIQTLTSLTNVQNSLFIPNLGRFVNRRPTYNLRRAPSEIKSQEEIDRVLAPLQESQTNGGRPSLDRSATQGTMATLATIDSRLSDSRFAVLPHGTSLEGWSKEDKKEMNDHVRHMLHSKRSKFKRSMKGFGQYIRRPLGFLVTLYAVLITLFGLAWVLFLIGWINVGGGRQPYIINIIDNVLVALFAIVGDGLAPFRAVDTYHMIYIAHYHHFTWSRRKKELLPELQDHNDLPATNAPVTGPRDSDPEDPEKQWEFTVLTPKQQAKLEHHQEKFCKSHSFYKPHETETHHAFPLRLLVAIVVLLDCHSLFQIALGACTWGISYHVRPMALTTVILCCSITCNATAGLIILIGDRRTRKKDVLERMNRQELTEEAIHKVEKKKEKESESENEEGSKARDSRLSLNIIRKHKHEESAYP